MSWGNKLSSGTPSLRENCGRHAEGVGPASRQIGASLLTMRGSERGERPADLPGFGATKLPEPFRARMYPSLNRRSYTASTEFRDMPRCLARIRLAGNCNPGFKRLSTIASLICWYRAFRLPRARGREMCSPSEKSGSVVAGMTVWGL